MNSKSITSKKGHFEDFSLRKKVISKSFISKIGHFGNESLRKNRFFKIEHFDNELLRKIGHFKINHLGNFELDHFENATLRICVTIGIISKMTFEKIFIFEINVSCLKSL